MFCLICFLLTSTHHIIDVKSAFCKMEQKGLDHYFEFVAKYHLSFKKEDIYSISRSLFKFNVVKENLEMNAK